MASPDYSFYLTPEWINRLRFNSPRRPVNLNRLPNHLLVSIIRKQASSTILDLRLTCSKCAALVDTAISQMAVFPVLEKKIIEHDCLAEMFDDRYGTKTLDDVARLGIIWSLQPEEIMKLDPKLAKILCREHDYMKKGRPLEILWEKAAAFGPKQINFPSIPDKLQVSIIYKMTLWAAVRFIRANKMTKNIVEYCISSNETINIVLTEMESNSRCHFSNVFVTKNKRKLSFQDSFSYISIFLKLIIQRDPFIMDTQTAEKIKEQAKRYSDKKMCREGRQAWINQSYWELLGYSDFESLYEYI